MLVWLHGGGYQAGSGTDQAGAGITFARSHGVVVVTFNYRLGALGFLGLDGAEHTGAYGLHDQIALLRRPVIDGLALNRRPVDAIAAGSAAGVPLLAGHCVDECGLYQLMARDTADQADRVLEDYFGKSGRDDILSAYTAARPHAADNPRQLRIDIMTDERYALPTTRLADAQSTHAPVWRSRYDGPLTGLLAQIAPGRALPAFHGSDTPLVWNGGPGIADQPHNAWGAFITAGSPQAAGLPPWPEYTREQRLTMIFAADGAHVEPDPDAARRAPWDSRKWQPGTWYQLDGL